MRKILLLSALLLSIGTTQAASIDCNLLDKQITSYPTYKTTIDAAMKKIATKDSVARSKITSKINNATARITSTRDSGTKIYTVIGYLYCKNKALDPQKVVEYEQNWKEITHANTWKSDKFNGSDYFFPDFKFSVPSTWNEVLALDRDDGSAQLFHDMNDQNNSIKFFVQSEHMFTCPTYTSYCSDSQKTKRTVAQKITLLRDYYKSKESITYEKSSSIKILGNDTYVSTDKKSYIFNSGESIVTLTFGKYDSLLISNVLGSIETDANTTSSLNNNSTSSNLTINTHSKNLGNGFTLIQDIENSNIMYNGKIIKTFSHTSKINPFVWGEACSEFVNILETAQSELNTYSSLSTTEKQKLWDNFGEKNQKMCMNSHINRTVSVKNTNSKNIFAIIQQFYESTSYNYYSTTLGKFILSDFHVDITKILESGTSTYMMYDGGLGCSGGILVYKNNKITEIFTNYCDINTGSSSERSKYKKITDFELISSQKIKVFYDNYNGSTIEKIISL